MLLLLLVVVVLGEVAVIADVYAEQALSQSPKRTNSSPFPLSHAASFSTKERFPLASPAL